MSASPPDTAPLLQHRSMDDVLAFRQGEPISVRQFLSDVDQVAQMLPERGHVLNLCRDRYRFAVGLAASMVRGQISLLPPSHNQDMLRQLQASYPDVYCLNEQADPEVALPLCLYPAEPAVAAPHVSIPQIPSDQVVAHVFTSGSTGQPKPHRKRWGPLVRCVRAEGEYLGLLGEQATSAIIGTVPPQHMYGLESTVIVAWQTGSAIVADRPFYAADIAQTLAGIPIRRVLVTTPFHLRSLLGEIADLPQVGLMVSATAPLQPQLAIEAERRMGAPLLEIYGSTETGQMAVRRTAKTAQWLAFKGLTLRDQDGTVWVSGGHLDQPTPLNDIVEIASAEGDPSLDHEAPRFILHGRSADMINIAGKRTSLGYLNLQLNAIPGVVDGVFIWPREDAGSESVTRLAAFVVAPSLDAEALKRELRQRIDPAFMPRPLHIVETLPRNDTGKLPRAALDDLNRLATARATSPADASDPSLPLTLPLSVPANHPALAGHFPGHPIVPGVVLLDKALLALAQAHRVSLCRLEIAVAKFLSPVKPGEGLSVTIKGSTNGKPRWTLDIQADDEVPARPVASATVQLNDAAQGT
jgi:acyl-coenzyme A synthetase/AMP-(fatty) acid ligase